LGKSSKSICQQLAIKPNTYHKALFEKRLVLPERPLDSLFDTKSSRNIEDEECKMGKSCTNELGRVLAARHRVPAISVFGNHLDLNHGGILTTLPALLSCGLLSQIEQFSDVSGYYTVEQVFITLAFLALLRVTHLEQSRGVPSGELGRCLGLDRIPEVKTLRKRIAAFCRQTDVEQWSTELSKQWMQPSYDPDGVLYVDGHVRLYYGRQADMPLRYVSRMRLCLSGSTDYWVNDRLGQPFFVVNKTLNEGMIKVLCETIIPRLNNEVPDQPSQEALEANEQLHRYMLVFDRECYSIDFFNYLEEERIAFCTYRKNVKEEWSEESFTDYEIIDENGEKEIVQLAESITTLYGKKENGVPQKSITVREVRKKSASGHQTAIITTNYKLTLVQIAVLMFARWCQENFFKYMIENFGLDVITSYSKNVLPATSKIVNPEYKDLIKEQKRISSFLSTKKVKYAEISLSEKQLSEKQMEKHIKKKATIQEEIDILEKKRADLIEKKKSIDRKISFGEANENKEFITSVNEQKFFHDTIKIIAYRAETAMVNMIRPQMTNPQQARSLLKRLYSSDADIELNNEKNILHIKIHRSNSKAEDKVILFLCQQLNQTQTTFPSANLTLVFDLVTV